MSAQVPLVLQNSVDSPISVFPISISTKCAILKEFWGFTVPQSQADNILREFDAYFAYYQEECRLAQMYIGSSGYLSTRTHRDICGIVKYLKQGMARDIIRTTLITELPPPVPTDAEQLVDNSIDLAASLLLMLQFDQHGRVFPLRNYLSWRSGTLRDFLWSTFPLSTGQRELIRLHKGFTARNFERKARIRVCWTNNLADHLRFEDWGEPRVFIFPYATILRLHQDLGGELYSPGLISETLKSLALLLPQWDSDSNKWFQKQQGAENMDSEATKCGHLSFAELNNTNFEYWHERLVILQAAFDERLKEQESKQWWYDRRWYAFAALAFTVLFGFLQSIEGAVQVYYAINPPR